MNVLQRTWRAIFGRPSIEENVLVRAYQAKDYTMYPIGWREHRAASRLATEGLGYYGGERALFRINADGVRCVRTIVGCDEGAS